MSEQEVKIIWESEESVVFKPIEIRGKKGRKKMKKANFAIYIPNMDADNFEKICNEKGLQFVYVEVPDHGRLIDREKMLDAIRLELAQAEACEDMEDYESWLHIFNFVRKFPIIPADTAVMHYPQVDGITPTIIPADKEGDK